MIDLSTRYMGLDLKNPIIVGSCGLTKSVEKIQLCEQAGAGAVVIKSLFEEVLAKDDWELDKSTYIHPEAYDYIQSEIQMQYGPKEYCDLISTAKKKVRIPLIGSINCVSDRWWPNFARQMEESGVDAIELNVFSIPSDTSINSLAIEKKYFNILEIIKSKLKVPVAMKVGNCFSSLPYFAKTLEDKGVNALVLFNRFTEPDIDVDKVKIKTSFSFSSENEMYSVLRWIGILSGQVHCDLSASTGIHSSTSIIKLLLAGVTTVQMVSVLYKKGIDYITTIVEEIKKWMQEHNYNSLDQYRGILNFNKQNLSDLYLRAQFMEKIKGID